MSHRVFFGTRKHFVFARYHRKALLGLNFSTIKIIYHLWQEIKLRSNNHNLPSFQELKCACQTNYSGTDNKDSRRSATLYKTSTAINICIDGGKL